MVSRDTKVHLVAVALALGTYILVASFLPAALSSWEAAIGLFIFQGIGFGGAHLYLAIRGEGGMVPPDARWRYVAVLTLVMVAVGVSIYAGDRTVADVDLVWFSRSFILVVVVVYLVVEAIESYRDARPE